MISRDTFLASVVIGGLVVFPRSASATAQTAAAAVQSAERWAGCYAGPGVGTVPGRMSVAWAPNADGFADSAQRTRLRANGTGRLDGPGFFMGGQIGCNWETRRWLHGVEADLQRTNLDEARDAASTVPGTALPETYLRVFGSDWTTTVRVRAGRLIRPTVLLYGTAGLAIADADTEDAVVLPDGSVNAVTDSRRRPGWTAGGGVEWLLTAPWSMRIGYLYADFGSFVTTSRNSAPGRTEATIEHAHDLAQHMAAVWVSLHF